MSFTFQPIRRRSARDIVSRADALQAPPTLWVARGEDGVYRSRDGRIEVRPANGRWVLVQPGYLDSDHQTLTSARQLAAQRQMTEGGPL